jgi:hypothetical protein
MGGRCHYVVNDNGQEQCERCERIKDEDVQQVQESDSHEEQKPQGGLKMWMCPRTMGGRCSFKTNDNGQEECRLCKRIKE